MLLKNALEAGRKYTATGAIPADMLRQTVYLAWERSHVQGANPRTLQAEKLSNLETERLLSRESILLNAARPYMRFAIIYASRLIFQRYWLRLNLLTYNITVIARKSPIARYSRCRNPVYSKNRVSGL